MIRRMFRVLGGLVACIVFWVLMLPLTLPTFILMYYGMYNTNSRHRSHPER